MPGARSISHLTHALPVVLLAECRDRDVSDRRLEFDQRMGTIVTKRWNSFAIGAEVGIVTNSTLVASPSNVVRIGFSGADRTITVNAKMNLIQGTKISDLFIEGGESMARMNLSGTEYASRAIVPIRATQTLVTDTKNRLW